MSEVQVQAREPAVAGTFYPGEPATLARAIDALMEKADHTPRPAKAIVAPHAGYVYSGHIAATAYGAVAHRRFERVVVFGPAHRWGFQGLAVPSAEALRTPLGDLAVDRAGVAAALEVPGVHRLDAAFDGEHSVEVQLPFIQRLFPEARVVPLVVGDAAPERVDAAMRAVWGGPETLIVVSSDLSHFHEQAAAQALDLKTAQTLEGLQGERLTGADACGVRALAGLTERAKALDLRITARDLRTSGDTSGRFERVVGYGAFTAEPADEAALSEDERATLIEAARRALDAVVHGRSLPAPDPRALPWPLRSIRRTFVTLEIGGHLRGCIGSIQAVYPLFEDVIANTAKSAVQDPRFPRMSAGEALRTEITVSILSHDRPLAFDGTDDLIDRLRPGHDGLILRDGARAALFLPKVWDVLPDPRAFVANLKAKAGLPPDYDSPTLRALVFTAETFGG